MKTKDKQKNIPKQCLQCAIYGYCCQVEYNKKNNCRPYTSAAQALNVHLHINM
jgi:hypothetical protein